MSSTGMKIRAENGSLRTVYQEPSGVLFYKYYGKKIYVQRAIPITHAGSLRSLGYSASASERVRRRALREAIAQYGWASVERKINALYVFNKNRRPKLAHIYTIDKNFIHSLK